MALKLDFSKVLVKDNTNRTTKAESDILQQANLIMARVTVETFNALSNTVANHEASLSLQAEQIALRVASTDFTGATIASLINQSAAEVKIQASKITLEGLITANGNFKVLADGSIEAVNAKLSGSITATKMVSPSNSAYYGEIGSSGGYIGLGLFDLNKGTEAFCEILEGSDGNGFIMRDRNNQTRIGTDATVSQIISSNGTVRISVSNTGVQILKNNVVIAHWGFN